MMTNVLQIINVYLILYSLNSKQIYVQFEQLKSTLFEQFIENNSNNSNQHYCIENNSKGTDLFEREREILWPVVWFGRRRQFGSGGGAAAGGGLWVV